MTCEQTLVIVNRKAGRRSVLKARSFGRLCMMALALAAWPVFAQNEVGAESATAAQDILRWKSPLVVVECVWLVLIGIGAPVYSWWVGKRSTVASNLRGLNMPRGSIRGILALLVVGSFVNVLVLGGPVLGEPFEIVVSAFGALTGSIIGFYFGSRSATSLPTTNQTTEDNKARSSQSGP